MFFDIFVVLWFFFEYEDFFWGWFVNVCGEFEECVFFVIVGIENECYIFKNFNGNFVKGFDVFEVFFKVFGFYYGFYFFYF